MLTEPGVWFLVSDPRTGPAGTAALILDVLEGRVLASVS